MAALHMATVTGALVMVLGMAAAGMAAAMVPVHMAAVMVAGTAVTACMEEDPHLVDQWEAPCMVQVLTVVGTAAVTAAGMAAIMVVMVPEP